MQRLTLFMIVAVTTIGFFAKGDFWGRFRFLPGSFQYIPELLGAAAAAYVMFAGTRSRFQFVRPVYWVIFGLLLVDAICGVLVNSVGSGPVFAGVRNYLRAIPWFFVPAAFAYDNPKILDQLRLLGWICVLQVPFAIEQRIKTGSSNASTEGAMVTGDLTSGTLQDSGILSTVLISAVCVAAAFYIRKLLAPRQFLIMFILFLLPTTINETKGTLLMLPIGLVITLLCASKVGTRLKYFLLAISLTAMFLAAFVPIYDAMNEGRRYGVSIGDFFSDSKNWERYVTTGKELGAEGQVGRLDALMIPVRFLSKKPTTFVFGLGMGNASHSSISPQFSGQYHELFKPLFIIAISRIFSELGFFGCLLLYILYWQLFVDSKALARSDNSVAGAFGAGWAGAVAIMAMATLYTTVDAFVSTSFLFWYFSGFVAAQRVRSGAALRAEMLAQRNFPNGEPRSRVRLPTMGTS